jgi:hypothetical protein
MVNRWTRLLALIGITNAASGGDLQNAQLPELDAQSAKGLQMNCEVVKKQFVVGEPVNIWCTVTNTTDSIKPIGWHPSAGLYFCLVQGEAFKFGGVLPLAIPQIREPITVKSGNGRIGYVLYLPAHKTLTIMLTYKPERAEKFRGRIVYDPGEPRDGWAFMNKEEGPPWKNDWIYSNVFEYQVEAGEKSQN